MTAVKSWTLLICIVSIISTLLEMLLPKGQMEKIFKVVLSIFILCALLIPLKDLSANINFNNKKDNFVKEENKLKNIVENQMKLSSEANLKSNIKKFLNRKNINPEKIKIIMDTDNNNCISIKKIEVYLSEGDKDKKDIIKNELEKSLDLKADVVVGSE